MAIQTPPTDCFDDSWRDTSGNHGHCALWLLICSALKTFTYLLIIITSVIQSTAISEFMLTPVGSETALQIAITQLRSSRSLDADNSRDGPCANRISNVCFRSLVCTRRHPRHLSWLNMSTITVTDSKESIPNFFCFYWFKCCSNASCTQWQSEDFWCPRT